MTEKQVKTKKRVANYGEVYTAPREVNAMPDLVKQETGRIESRFLEPARGNGNFLIEVLTRKPANEILDLLPQSLWSDKDAKFLDPCSKTGVFLREIAKRLLKGLEKEIPDLRERMNHIFKNQLYGIAITELATHLTRCSVYCSKHAAGKFSVCDVFDGDSGNILFSRTEHAWKNGAPAQGRRCVFCGAAQENYDRGDELETHAYQFIHTENAGEFLNMKTYLFRFLVSQFMFSHHVTKDSYKFVPILDMAEPWTDEKLYKKYGLMRDETAFIESMIRPMEAEEK
jgi:hypothetical protein